MRVRRKRITRPERTAIRRTFRGLEAGSGSDDVQGRFWPRVQKDGAGGCWLWIGTKTNEGYGTIRVGEKLCVSHRVGWELVKGPIPDGMLALHKCDNPSCVNPDHLFLGTNADNAQDKMRKGRATWGARSATAKLTEAAVLEMRRRARAGETTANLARAYGVTKSVARKAILGLTWRLLDDRRPAA